MLAYIPYMDHMGKESHQNNNTDPPRDFPLGKPPERMASVALPELEGPDFRCRCWRHAASDRFKAKTEDEEIKDIVGICKDNL